MANKTTIYQLRDRPDLPYKDLHKKVVDARSSHTFEELLESALRQWHEARPGDELSPGLMLSYLGDEFYAALHTFEGSGTRKVVCSGRGPTLRQALINCKARKARGRR